MMERRSIGTRLVFSLCIASLGAAACRHDPDNSTDLKSRPPVSNEEAPADRELRATFNQLMMKKLHQKKLSDGERARLQQLIASYPVAPERVAASQSDWHEEELAGPELGKVRLVDFLKNLEAWVNGKRVDRQDLGLNFVATQNNRITTLSDKEQVWPALMQDLAEAKDSIHIVIFGLMGDAWGKEVFDLLTRKVREGVVVRILADALGARDHWYFKHANKPFLDEMRARGLEIITTSNPNLAEGLHFDHRKFYVIDGKVAYNTGYTIEEHMRHVHFDMAFRVEGDMVNQMQGHFFASYFHFGGKIPNGERAFSAFMSRYFPDKSPASDGMPARLLANIPWVQHRATESYYERIQSAKTKVTVINEFLSEPRFLSILEDKAKAGVKLQIIYPRLSEWSAHRYDAYNFFEGLKRYRNVEMYLYDGPQNTGWLHTKGILIDDRYMSFGSTNMDSLSLYHNYEMNIESEDARIVADVQRKILDYAIGHSKPYEMPNTMRDKIRTWTAPAVSIPLKYFFKAM